MIITIAIGGRGLSKLVSARARETPKRPEQCRQRCGAKNRIYRGKRRAEGAVGRDRRRQSVARETRTCGWRVVTI